MARFALVALVAALAWSLAAPARAEEPAQATVRIGPSPSAVANGRGGAKPIPGAAKPVAAKPVAVPTNARATSAAKVATPAKAAARLAKKPSELPAGAKWHTVRAGQKLGSIARRYNVTIPALLGANDLARRDKLQPGMRLLVPAPGDDDGLAARAVRRRLLGLPANGGDATPGRGDEHREPALARVASRGQDAAERDARRSQYRAPKDANWLPFVEKPRKKGVVRFRSREQDWTGRLLRKSGRVSAAARREVERIFGADSGIGIDVELLRQLVRISDTFGGRTIRVVSGFRTAGAVERSRHKEGKALDFTVDGVSVEALYDYCRSLDGVGVGFYSTSGFVHLDVRDRWTTWIDESGRGEPPRPVNTSHPSPDAGSPAPAETPGTPANGEVIAAPPKTTPEATAPATSSAPAPTAPVDDAARTSP
jgi:LysM repeat protein